MSAKRNGKFRKRKASAARQKLIIAIAVAGILLIGAIIALVLLMNGDNAEVPEETTVPTTTAVATTTQAPTETEPPETTVEPTETTQPPETTAPKETQKETEPKSSGGNTYTPPAVQNPTIPAVTVPQKVVLSLPYVVPGSSLEIQRVAGYDGIFLEDGSDSNVAGVAMAQIKNTGSEAVEYAKISMKYDDKTLTFEISALPAGSVVAVQEQNKNSGASGDLLECTADVAVLDELGLSEDQISVTDNGDNSLTVTNLTDQEIVTVRIFYKYYMGDENAYVGGITYTAKISNLAAGASVVVNPSHYASGASTVVMVRTYDTDV